MGRKPKHSPSFFKVLIGDFTKKLRIPSAFVKNLEGKLPKKCILKTDDTGKSRQVSMERVEQDYFFSNGWRKFVKVRHLEVGDFLVFWLIGDSTFQVVTYGRSGCQKDVSLAVQRNRECLATLSEQNQHNPRISRNSGLLSGTTACTGAVVKSARRFPMKMEIKTKQDVEAAGSVKPKHPFFVSILRNYHRYVMCIPRDFARETGIARKRSTVLKDPEGRVWPVSICATGRGRIGMSNGWSDLRKANKLADGDTCLFQFIQEKGNLIHVQILQRVRRIRSSCKEPWALSS